VALLLLLLLLHPARLRQHLLELLLLSHLLQHRCACCLFCC
jgi:hypothetical protein